MPAGRKMKFPLDTMRVLDCWYVEHFTDSDKVILSQYGMKYDKYFIPYRTKDPYKIDKSALIWRLA